MMILKHLNVTFALLCFHFGIINAALSFANYYGSHMVLQQAPKSNTVWGYNDKASERVNVELSGHPPIQTSSFYDTAIREIVWKVILPPEKGTQTFNITVTSLNEEIRITDVLFGDVWLCSGQSNMQFTLSMLHNGTEEIADAEHYPNIRLFTVGMNWSPHEEYDVSVKEAWSRPNRESVGHSDWSYFSAVCWLYGKHLHQTLNYPIGLIASTWRGTPIEAWSSRQAMDSCQSWRPDIDTRRIPQINPTVLWNAMIHPLLNLTIYGAIWYQGESNAIAPDMYKCRFTTLIQDWRDKFNKGSNGQTDKMFPFGFVQLAGNEKDPTTKSGYPDIRWHQTADFGYAPNTEMPATFMAVAMDLPDFTSRFTSIHPRDKQDVAARLVLSGLSVAYNRDMGKYQGPQISAYDSDIGLYTLRIELDKGKYPIEVRSKDGFELCCSRNTQSNCDGTDSKWLPFPIIAHTDSSVTFNYAAGCAGQWLMGIRYAWKESPCEFKKCAVYSVENGVPMAPFRSIGLINTDKLSHKNKYMN